MPKRVVITVEPHEQPVKVYYLGGLHKPGQKIMQIIHAQSIVNFPAKVGEYVEMQEWAARDLERRYTIQGNSCFTTNGNLAKRVAKGEMGIRADGTVVERVQMSDEEILRRAAEIQASLQNGSEEKKKSGKKSDYDKTIEQQAEELARLEA